MLSGCVLLRGDLLNHTVYQYSVYIILHFTVPGKKDSYIAYDELF